MHQLPVSRLKTGLLKMNKLNSQLERSVSPNLWLNRKKRLQLSGYLGALKAAIISCLV